MNLKFEQFKPRCRFHLKKFSDGPGWNFFRNETKIQTFHKSTWYAAHSVRVKICVAKLMLQHVARMFSQRFDVRIEKIHFLRVRYEI